MGRKIAYNFDDLPESYFDDIIEMMKEKGMSKKEVMAEFGITPSVHTRFMRDYPKYKEAFDTGQFFAEAWWMKQGRENLENKGFNTGVYAFQMKNRYKWRDVPIVVGGNERTLADQLKEKEIMDKFKKPEEKKNEKVIN